MRTTGLAALLLSAVCFAQTSQPPATADELVYLRFVLLNVASIDHDPSAIKAYEDSLVKLHGLNTQESALIHAAGQTLHPLLAQLRQSTRAIVANKTSLSEADKVALANLDAQREQAIIDRANQVLNSVRGETAARLRAPGHILANAVGKN